MSSALRGTSYIENGTPGPMPGRWTVRVRKFHPANFLVIALLISMILNPHGMLSYFLLGLVVSTFFMGTGLGMYSAWRTLRAEARAHAAVTNALFGHTPRESLHSFRLQSGLLDQQFDNLNYDVLREFGYVNFSAARPLREEEINLLSVHRYKLTRTQSEGSYVEDADGTKECFEEELTCSICLEDAKIGEIIRTLPCYHEFHVACIDPWLRLKGTCPMCKVIAWESS